MVLVHVLLGRHGGGRPGCSLTLYDTHAAALVRGLAAWGSSSCCCSALSKPGAWLKPCPMGNDIVFGMLNDIVFGFIGVLTRTLPLDGAGQERV